MTSKVYNAENLRIAEKRAGMSTAEAIRVMRTMNWQSTERFSKTERAAIQLVTFAFACGAVDDATMRELCMSEETFQNAKAFRDKQHGRPRGRS